MKKLLAKMDLPLLFLMIIFSAFGLVMIFSASSITAVLRYQDSASVFFKKQLITYIGMFIIGFVVILKVPTKDYYKFSRALLYALIISLIYVLIEGNIINGSKSWLSFGSYNFQPTEIAKAVMIFFMATEYNRINNGKTHGKYDALIPIGVSIIIAALIYIQGDLGGAVIIILIAALIFIAVPIKKSIKNNIYKICGIGLILIVPLVLLNSNKIFSSMQASRFNFLKPCSRYQEDTGYQVCNGYIAIHNGGLFGVGLGDSTQKYLYLPESHTDFIFPIICEELGMIVGILVILCYIWLLYRILLISKNATNLRNSILAYGTFAFILVHILINLLGVLGLIPLTGVPLPFLSYGGSHALSIFTMLFIVQRVAIESKEEKKLNKIKKV